jgi:uncharacterized membrane protein
MALELALIAVAAIVALAMAPWRTLSHPALRSPWLGCLVLLPLLWAAERALPGGVVLQMTGAALLVLMFGWPLAVATLLPVAALGAWLGGHTPAQAVSQLAWNGMVAATFALGVGLAVRRWLPQHVFVFILGRGFIGTALALMGASLASAAWVPLPPGTDLASLLLAHWLMAWAEAFATGMFTAIFVAFRPEWLASWSDRRYLRDS